MVALGLAAPIIPFMRRASSLPLQAEPPPSRPARTDWQTIRTLLPYLWGYRGRIGIYSVMVMSERLKEMVVNLTPEADVSKAAKEEGMLTLKEAGLVKVRAGVTSIEEVSRVAS